MQAGCDLRGRDGHKQSPPSLQELSIDTTPLEADHPVQDSGPDLHFLCGVMNMFWSLIKILKPQSIIALAIFWWILSFLGAWLNDDLDLIQSIPSAVVLFVGYGALAAFAFGLLRWQSMQNIVLRPSTSMVGAARRALAIIGIAALVFSVRGVYVVFALTQHA